jgi:hypothetical protein
MQPLSDGLSQFSLVFDQQNVQTPVDLEDPV